MHPEVPPSKVSGFLPLVRGQDPVLIYGGDSGSDFAGATAAKELMEYAAGRGPMPTNLPQGLINAARGGGWYEDVVSVAVAGPHTPQPFAENADITVRGPADYVARVHVPLAKRLVDKWLEERARNVGDGR